MQPDLASIETHVQASLLSIRRRLEEWVPHDALPPAKPTTQSNLHRPPRMGLGHRVNSSHTTPSESGLVSEKTLSRMVLNKKKGQSFSLGHQLEREKRKLKAEEEEEEACSRYAVQNTKPEKSSRPSSSDVLSSYLNKRHKKNKTLK